MASSTACPGRNRAALYTFHLESAASIDIGVGFTPLRGGGRGHGLHGDDERRTATLCRLWHVDRPPRVPPDRHRDARQETFSRTVPVDHLPVVRERRASTCVAAVCRLARGPYRHGNGLRTPFTPTSDGPSAAASKWGEPTSATENQQFYSESADDGRLRPSSSALYSSSSGQRSSGARLKRGICATFRILSLSASVKPGIRPYTDSGVLVMAGVMEWSVSMDVDPGRATGRWTTQGSR